MSEEKIGNKVEENWLPKYAPHIILGTDKSILNIQRDEFYNSIFKNLDSVEGEILQQIFFYFKELEIEEIPTIEEIEQIRTDLKKIFKDRHEVFKKENLYE